MLNSVSPAVLVAEIDNTTVAPTVSSTLGGMVGNFRWGPAEERVLVSSEIELRSKFATPSKVNAVDFHLASHFLGYSGALEVVRGLTSVARTANSAGASDVTVKNDADYEAATFVFADAGLWMAKYVGALGNSLKVEVFGFKTDASTTATNFASWAYSGRFTGPPGTSQYASNLGATNDEVHVVVIDEDGAFTGLAGSVLEVYPFLSQALDAKTESGATNYFGAVVNSRSNYVRFGAPDTTNMPESGGNVASGTSFAVSPASGVTSTSLSGGVDSAALTSSEFSLGFDLFSDPALSDVSVLICPDLPSGSETTIANALIAIAEGRKDCIAFISPGAAADTVTKIKTFANALTSSSFSARDSGRIVCYDKYNDELITVPACGSVAGLYAATAAIYGPWNSPAGARRGQIRNVVRLKINPNKAERDTLYAASVNPIVTFPGEGTLLYGDKTGLNRPSAFDRLNVRGLFTLLEKSIKRAAKDLLFENNTEFTRAQFVSIVEPLLRNIQGAGGIQAFQVVCNRTNNTGDVIDRNEFVGDIYIKPSRSINVIGLNFIATRTGVEFNVVTGG